MTAKDPMPESGFPLFSDSANLPARDRIRSVEELAAISADAKAAGKRVVMVHGVFDLFHLGHVRHLESAKKMGDVLIATVTADPFVNKGPGRPVFRDVLRAEMLTSVSHVDWAGVNHDPTAEPLIKLIQPDVYVKGSDYKDLSLDITGKIRDEKDLVKAYGGRIAFTDEITFSSSELINAHLSTHTPETRAMLDRLKQNGGEQRLLDIIDGIADLRVLMIGETIIDQYDFVHSLGKTTKDTIVAVQHTGREMFAGGVIAAANHAAGFCKEVEVITGLGGTDSHEDIIRASLHENVTLCPIKIGGRPTLRKRRFVESQPFQSGLLKKLFEVYYMDDHPLPAEVQEGFEALIEDRIGEFDVVVMCDFGHGLIANSTIEKLYGRTKFLAVNAQSNAGNMGYNQITRYPGADYICIDEPEARIATSSKHGDIAHLVDKDLTDRIDCRNIIVTRGKHGCTIHQRGQDTRSVPGFGLNPVDTMGAGDAFLAVTAPLLANGADITDVGFIGNVVGGLKVGVVGHRKSVDKVSVKKAITALLK